MERDLAPALAAGPDGTSRLRVVLTPGARRPGLGGYDQWRQAIAVAVAAPPRQGCANRALCELLAITLELPPGSVTVVAGARNRAKTVLLPLPPGEAAERLARALEAP